MNDKIFCFLDTNAMIHFRTFEEVDWLTILATSEVYLILAPIVLNELDKLKLDSSNEWRQKRARALISKLNLGFWQDSNISNHIKLASKDAKANAPSDDEIAQKVSEERDTLKRIIDTAYGASRDEIDDFMQEYTLYLEQLEPALRFRRSKDFGQRYESTFILENSGAVPAENVKISLQFPLETFV